MRREVNNIEGTERDKTHKKGKNQIDAALATEGFLGTIRGSKQVDFGEVLVTDHRGFLLDIDTNYYFKINAIKYDENNSTNLKHANRKHEGNLRDKIN